MGEQHSYYYSYTEEQFAGDEYFQQWVLKNNTQTEQFWKEWLQQYPHKTAEVQQAREMVLQLAENDYREPLLSPDEKATLKENIFQQLNIKTQDKELPDIKPKGKWRQWIAAASIFGGILLGIYFLFKPDGAITSDTIQVAANETKQLLLPDSSVVILNANSTLTYHRNFIQSQNREVTLSGNAFFKVRRNTQQPFIVHTGLLDVQVLGTMFNVNASGPAAEIVLTSGSVKLKTIAEGKEMLMNPGDKMKYDTLSKSFHQSRISPLLYSAWTNSKWVFSQTSLEEIMHLVGEYYGVTVRFTNTAHKSLKMSAVIPAGSLQMLLPVIERTLGRHIRQVNNELIIE